MYLLLAAVLIAVDQVTKIWAYRSFAADRSSMPVGLGFNFTYTENTGAAFGIFQNISFQLGPIPVNGTVLLGILSAIVSLVIFIYLLRNAKDLPVLQRYALTLILAGAVGNMIDRFYFQYVRDFIHFQIPQLNFAVFNVADSCVVIGAALLMLASLLPQRQETEQRPAFAQDSSASEQ